MTPLDPILALTAALIGYGLGAISFARVITRLVKPEQDISHLEMQVPGTDIRVRSDAVSATTVRLHLGPQYGCLVGLLDILKAAAPTLAFKLLYPDQPYYLFAATFAIVGHIFPIYYRFHGGRGLSPLIGGMLVVDWLGTLLLNSLTAAFGVPKHNSLLAGLGIVLMIPWTWLRSHDPWQTGYMLIANALFWGAMIPELRQYAHLRRAGQLDLFRQSDELQVPTRTDSDELAPMSIHALWGRLRARWRRSPPS